MNTITRLLREFALVLVATVAFFSATSSHAFFLSPPKQTVVEFLNENTKRRLLLATPAEINFVETGLAGPGWHRSGLVFSVPVEPKLPGVFRFYAPSVNSHFYTMDPVELEVLNNPTSGWIYEGRVFGSYAPLGGVCPAASPMVVYRLYNNRAQFRDTTHRYTPDRVVRQALVDQGWIDEGAAMCAIDWFLGPVATYLINATKVLPSAECEDESRNLGSCVALNQTPLLPILVPTDVQLPPYAAATNGNTVPLGRLPRFATIPDGDIVTLVDSPLLSDITAHSFVQLPRSGVSYPFVGVYVNSQDRTTSPQIPYMSINPLYQFVTSPPATNEADRRVRPWRDGTLSTLVLSFSLDVTFIRRADEASHAISHPTLELIDTRSRRNIYITLAGAQTVPLPQREAEDYFAADVGTGKVIVSTSFRDNPSFGERLRGTSIFCAATATSHQCDQPRNTGFIFRLRPADIAYVVAKARKLDPSLSPNIADYAIDNFSFNNELYGNAELAVALSYYQLTLYEQQY